MIRRAMHRLLLALVGDRYPQDSGIVIDSAEMIRECEGVFSNREKVEYIHALAADHAKLAGWVDREFRMFAVGPSIVNELKGHNVLDASLFWTRGHSIENYFFDGNERARVTHLGAI